jgi:hypothetical protein
MLSLVGTAWTRIFLPIPKSQPSMSSMAEEVQAHIARGSDTTPAAEHGQRARKDAFAAFIVVAKHCRGTAGSRAIHDGCRCSACDDWWDDARRGAAGTLPHHRLEHVPTGTPRPRRGKTRGITHVMDGSPSQRQSVDPLNLPCGVVCGCGQAAFMSIDHRCGQAKHPACMVCPGHSFKFKAGRVVCPMMLSAMPAWFCVRRGSRRVHALPFS